MVPWKISRYPTRQTKNKNMDAQELKIEEGSINFWIKEHQLDFNDGQTTPLLSVNPTGGSIFIVKDADNKLKVFYVVLERGRVDLESNVSSLNPEIKHMITYAWNLPGKKVNLYIDGKEAATKEIPF